MNEPDTSFLSPAERKRFLIAQGAAFRESIAQASHVTQAGLRPTALVSGALGHVASTLASFLGGGAGGLDMATVLPLVISGASTLGKRIPFKRVLLKPMLGGVLVLGVLGLTAVLVKRRKEARAEADVAEPAEPRS